MGRRPNQPHHASFNIRQQHVLLRLVEPVDFVNEQNGGLPLVFEAVGRGGEHAAHVRHVGFHPAEPLELAAGLPGNNVRERGFACSRRTIKDQGLNPVRLDSAAQKLSGAEHVRLPHKLAQIARSQARGQRLGPEGAQVGCARARRFRPRRGRKQFVPWHGAKITVCSRFAQNKKRPRPSLTSPADMQNPQIPKENVNWLLATGRQQIGEELGFPGLLNNRQGS